MNRMAVTALLALLVLSGTGPAMAADEPAKADNDPVVNVRADDPEMNAAKLRAIASLPEFYRRLASPAADESEFMVKFDILPGDEAEFVWATDLDRSTTPMTGVLINQPIYTDDQIGQRVPIAEADIIDWAYRRGAVMQGNYTTRVLLDRMSEAEAAEFRAYLGW